VKSIFTYLILSVFTLINLQQLVLIASYSINKEYITQKFCINKDKPELKCNGKCHLKDVMAKSDNEQKEKNTPVGIELLFSVFYIDFNEEISFEKIINRDYNIFNKKLIAKYTSFIFHPPPILSFT